MKYKKCINITITKPVGNTHYRAQIYDIYGQERVFISRHIKECYTFVDGVLAEEWNQEEQEIINNMESLSNAISDCVDIDNHAGKCLGPIDNLD
jgi:hypothetical protein